VGHLATLLAELDAAVESRDGRPRPPVSEPTRHFARRLILAHRVGRPVDLVDALLAGAPPVLHAQTGVAYREAIGTDGCVFLWLGVAAYEQPPFVLILDPLVEQPDEVVLEASPWDTGGLRGHRVLQVALTDEEARWYVAHYSVEGPDHRGYLAAVVDACFERPDAHVAGAVPLAGYPGTGGGRRAGLGAAAHTFEVRVLESLSLDGRIVSVVFDPSVLGAQDPLPSGKRTAAFRRWCRDQGIRAVEVSGADRSRLRSRIVGEVRRILGDEGALP
jgi:hypothetical protein